MYAMLLTLFILGCFIQVVGAVTVVVGPDQRHWGVVAIFLGAVVTVVAGVLSDGLS